MPTTRKQKTRARKSREADMLSDSENLDIMLSSNRLEREESEFREDEIRCYAGNGRNSRDVDSCSEINKLSGELNQRITQEMNDLMSSVSSEIQRAISEAINEQVLPQIQPTSRSRQGQLPDRRWEVPGRRPEC